MTHDTMLDAVAHYFESNCFSWRINKAKKLTPSAVEPAAHNTFNRKYCVVRKLGSGGYGTVFLVARRSDGRQFAAKIVPKERCRRTTWCPRRQTEIPDEVHIWEGISQHENIVKFEECYLERGHWIIVTEYHAGFQDLFDFNTETKEPLSELEVVGILRQVVTMCLSLRDSGVDHRDIKDENLLYNPETKQVKLIDFGSAAKIDTSQSYSHIQGTDVYIPQEYYTTGSYTADGGAVWAIGCLAYILLARQAPFQNRDHVRAYKKLSWTTKTRGPVSDEARAFVEKCLDRDPESRWCLDEMVSCEWLEGKKCAESRLQRHG